MWESKQESCVWTKRTLTRQHESLNLNRKFQTYLYVFSNYYFHSMRGIPHEKSEECCTSYSSSNGCIGSQTISTANAILSLALLYKQVLKGLTTCVKLFLSPDLTLVTENVLHMWVALLALLCKAIKKLLHWLLVCEFYSLLL